jgi:hypothetical protein
LLSIASGQNTLDKTLPAQLSPITSQFVILLRRPGPFADLFQGKHEIENGLARSAN